MLRKLVVPIAVLGIFFVWRGLNSWLDVTDTQTLAMQYIHAVMLNDKETILKLTHPALRDEVKREFDSASFIKQQKPDDYRILIHHTKKTGPETSLSYLRGEGLIDAQAMKEHAAPTMLVNFVIELDGYQLKPNVHLEMATNGGWYVTFLDGMKVDPRWTDLNQPEEKQKSQPQPKSDLQQATEELRKAFEETPGVTVEPLRQ